MNRTLYECKRHTYTSTKIELSWIWHTPFTWKDHSYAFLTSAVTRIIHSWGSTHFNENSNYFKKNLKKIYSPKQGMKSKHLCDVYIIRQLVEQMGVKVAKIHENLYMCFYLFIFKIYLFWWFKIHKSDRFLETSNFTLFEKLIYLGW